MKAEAVIEVSTERNRPGRKNWVRTDWFEGLQWAFSVEAAPRYVGADLASVRWMEQVTEGWDCQVETCAGQSHLGQSEPLHTCVVLARTGPQMAKR